MDDFSTDNIISTTNNETSQARVPPEFLKEHTAAMYEQRMSIPGNTSWVTPIEAFGFVQYLSAAGLANVTLHLCRYATRDSNQLFLCGTIVPTTAHSNLPEVDIFMLNCNASDEGKAQGTEPAHWS